MTQNPFESPQANPYTNQAPAQATTGQFDIGQAISDGWAAMTANAGVAIGGTVVVGLLSVLAAITIIGYFVLLPVLAYGMLRLLLNITDGEGDINDIFSGFQNYGSVLGSMLMFMLIMIVVMIGVSLPGMVLAGVGGALELPALAVLGQMINLVITYAITPRLYFGPFFIADQGVGGLDALKMSWKATREQKLMSFILLLVTGIIGFAGVIACGVGLLFSLPLSYIIWTAAYRQMVPRT